MRIAAIDIGSNSIRSTIVDVPVDGPRVVLDEEKVYARLGRGTVSTGRLSDAAMDQSARALDMMLRIAREYEVTHIRAVATAAVRSASNGPEFVARLRDEIGLDVEVISGEHEGRLALLSAIESLALVGRVAVVDIGGGSVEIIRAFDREVQDAVSLPLGAVVLSDRFRTGDPFPDADYRQLGEYVRHTLATALTAAEEPPRTFVGSGGTVTTLAAMIAADRSPGLANMHGFAFSRSESVALRARLAVSTASERSAIKGMSDGRIDLIVVGAVVLDEVMAALGAEIVVVNARGMREGIVIEAVERERGVAPAADRMRSVREFREQCRADVPHSEHVCRLSRTLFDELRGPLDLDPGTWPVLEAAALLHDVGYHISHEQHHKHSYHLIAHAALPGFCASDRRLIATIARYHAGPMPKSKHEAMQGLSSDEVASVSQMAALLRLADGLDRSRGQRVADVTAEILGQAVRLWIAGRSPLDIEIHGAMRKADLFERVWGLTLEVGETGEVAPA